MHKNETKIFLILFILTINLYIILKKYKDSFTKSRTLLNYNYTFVIVQKKTRMARGLMSYYYHNLGCALHYIHQGYIPIIDLASHQNIFNGFNINNNYNPWETFFNQPFGYKLENVLKYAKNIIYEECDLPKLSPFFTNLNNTILINYWHNIANIYMPIKEQFINNHVFNQRADLYYLFFT